MGVNEAHETAGATGAAGDPSAMHPIKGKVLKSALWYVKLRWVAIATLGIGSAWAKVMEFQLSMVSMGVLVIYLLLANVAFSVVAERLLRGFARGRTIRLFTNAQIIVDWIAVVILIHLTGGITSPLTFLFLFHLVIPAILLPALNIYINAVIAVVLLGLLFLAEGTGLMDTHPLLPGLAAQYSDYRSSLAVFGAFALSSFVIVYMANRVGSVLRHTINELTDTGASLRHANGRLTAMYEVMTLLGFDRDLDEVLDTIVTKATSLWGIKGAFLSLGEPGADQFRLAAMHGLGDDIEPGAPGLLEDASCRKKLQLGRSVSIDDLTGHQERHAVPAMQWLHDSQGIRSMLVVPLRVGGELMGCFCLVSRYRSRFTDEDERYFGLFCEVVAIEIERIRTNQRLVAHGKNRTWFYRKAAHDLRSPLAAVQSMLSLVTEGIVTDPGKVEELVDRSVTRIKRLLELINDLLVLAEDRTDELTPRKEELSFPSLVRSSVELYQAQAAGKRLTVSSDVDDAVASIHGTRDGLERVVNNLVSNAIKYTPEGGTVQISLRALDHGFVGLAVADSGIGIPESAQAEMFKEFFRAPNARKLQEVGTGLGLVITKRIVEEHDGAIRFESVEGRGTTFSVVLPTVASPRAIKAADVPFEPPSGQRPPAAISSQGDADDTTRSP